MNFRLQRLRSGYTLAMLALPWPCRHHADFDLALHPFCYGNALACASFALAALWFCSGFAETYTDSAVVALALQASCGLVLGACSLREHRNGCVVVSWRLPSRLASPWLLTGMQMYFLSSQASC